MAVFYVPGYIYQPDKYLSTLDRFLDSSADLSVKIYLNSAGLCLLSPVR